MSKREGKWELRFNLKGVSLDTDGSGNPAWRKAADRYDVVRGDLGPLGETYVAILEVDGDTGEHRGRDSMGRAVVLIPLSDDDVRRHERAVERTRISRDAKRKSEAARAARIADKEATMYGGTYGVEWGGKRVSAETLARVTGSRAATVTDGEHVDSYEHGGDRGSLGGIVSVFR